MKSKLYLATALFMGLSSMAQAASYQPNEVIVKFKEGKGITTSSIQAVYNRLGVEKVHFYSKNIGRMQHLTLKPGIDVNAAVAEIKRDANVEFAQPNYILTIPEKNPSFLKKAKKRAEGKQLSLQFAPEFTFEITEKDSKVDHEDDRPEVDERPELPEDPIADPKAKQLWGLNNIHAYDAWKMHGGKEAFTVAVIDTGIDYNHEDLGYNLWRKQDADGYDIVGHDFVHDDDLPYDDQGHGTHTAGSVGAVGANGKGIVGVSPRVSIMSLKFLSKEGGGTTSDAIRAIDYAITHKAKILSNSWGGSEDEENDALKASIERAEKKGILFVVAAGNNSTNNDESEFKSYPASFTMPNIISVAATDVNDEIAYFSNFGPKTTHLAAPGVNVLSTVPGNVYKAASGTSMAAPHVAGAAALLWSVNPRWGYKRIKQMILDAVDPVSGLEEKVSTGGRLNVFKAMKTARTLKLKGVQ